MFVSNVFVNARNTSLAMALILLLTVMFFFLKGRALKWKRPFILITIACNVIYLVWRSIYTLPLNHGIPSMIFGILLLAAELMGFCQSAVFRMIFTKAHQNTPHSLDEWAEVPTVDVFIATYNESVAILQKTAMACQALEYPA
ncbi:MAG: hypothetical protein LLF96_08965, partial [Eubacteriales bacterium]|nr:hypothetical protein [Eubacteriales bacterium]